MFAAIALAAALGVSACGKKKPAPPPATAAARARGAAPRPRRRPRRRPRPRRAKPRRAPLTEDEVFASKSLDELNAEKPLADVFFALDSAQLGDDAKPVLQKDADWMKRWTSTKS